MPGEVEAQVVFAGYGRVNAGQKIDDYEGLDVKNRFVLVYEGQPDASASPPKAEPRRRRPFSNPFAQDRNRP